MRGKYRNPDVAGISWLTLIYGALTPHCLMASPSANVKIFMFRMMWKKGWYWCLLGLAPSAGATRSQIKASLKHFFVLIKEKSCSQYPLSELAMLNCPAITWQQGVGRGNLVVAS